MTVGWLDCSAGVAGDMLLGALTDLGVLTDLADMLAALPGVQVSASSDVVRRHGQRAVSVTVTAPAEQPERRLADVLAIVDAAPVEDRVKSRVAAVFQRLATAEATVHGIAIDDVHFHEVGAVDAIADVLGCCLGLQRLALDRLVVSPIALGSGSADTSHGRIPVPGPAVLQLLAGTPIETVGGSEGVELATPTGVAVVTEWAGEAGQLPLMSITRVGVGAGSRELADRPNVVRLVTGNVAESADTAWHVLEANIDDLDPRLWPGVLTAVLAAGAADAWLTPILMKKGRPAHTLHALCPAAVTADVGDAVFAQTSTIGLRSHAVGKRALDREFRQIVVAGQPVNVKLARLDGRVVTATPEWADVEAAARAASLPAHSVLTIANAAAAAMLDAAAPPDG